MRGDGGQCGHGVGWAEATANRLADAIVDIGGLRKAVGGQRKDHTRVAQARRIGRGFIPRHQIPQRQRVCFFGISNDRGIRKVDRQHKLSAHGNDVIQSAELVAGAKHDHVQLKLFGEGVGPGGIHLVLGVKQHRLPSGKNGGQSHHGVRLRRPGTSRASGHPAFVRGLVVGRIHQRLPGQSDGSHQRDGIALKPPTASTVKAHALHGFPRPRTRGETIFFSGREQCPRPSENTFAGLNGHQRETRPPVRGPLARIQRKRAAGEIKFWVDQTVPVGPGCVANLSFDQNRGINESRGNHVPGQVMDDSTGRDFTIGFNGKHTAVAKHNGGVLHPLSGSRNERRADQRMRAGSRTGHAIGTVLKLGVCLIPKRDQKHKQRRKRNQTSGHDQSLSRPTHQ